MSILVYLMSFNNNYKIKNLKIPFILVLISLIAIVGSFILISFGKDVSNPNDPINDEILTTSLSFVGVVLALLFTLIILPLQKILDNYSQDLIKKIINDETFLHCLGYFIFLFAYDFSVLMIFPVFNSNFIGATLLIISFSGGLFSLVLLSMFIRRIFYLLDIRCQIKEINEEINIKGIKNSLLQLNIIFDIIQRAILEGRSEISEYGLTKIKESVENLDGFSLELVNVLLSNLRGMVDSVSRKTNFNTLSLIVDISTIIILRFDLKDVILDFIYLLEYLFFKDDLKDEINLKDDILEKFLEIGEKSVDEVFKEIIKFLGKVSI